MEEFQNFVTTNDLQKLVQQYGRMRAIQETELGFKAFFSAKQVKDTIQSFVVFTPLPNGIVEVKSVSLNTTTKAETTTIIHHNRQDSSQMKLTARMHNEDVFLKITKTFSGEPKLALHCNSHTVQVHIDETPENILSQFGLIVEPLKRFYTREDIWDHCMCMDYTCRCMDVINDSKMDKVTLNSIFEQIFTQFEEHFTVSQEFYDASRFEGIPFTGNLLPSLAYLSVA